MVNTNADAPEVENIGDVVLMLGSETDIDNANIILSVWYTLGINYRVVIVSCHRHTGKGIYIGGDKNWTSPEESFEEIIDEAKEKIIVFLGGMELPPPGLIESRKRNQRIYDCLVFGIPTDKPSRSSIENLPMGTAILTSGLNEVSLKHSLTNSALALAKLVALRRPEIFKALGEWYSNFDITKPLIPNIPFTPKGLIDREALKALKP